jgi:hypothetical protein
MTPLPIRYPLPDSGVSRSWRCQPTERSRATRPPENNAADRAPKPVMLTMSTPMIDLLPWPYNPT